MFEKIQGELGSKIRFKKIHKDVPNPATDNGIYLNVLFMLVVYPH